MKLTTQRESLLKPLQAVIGVVERRQTMPILANVLMAISDGKLSITATDLEVELIAIVDMPDAQNGEITVPGRKLLDICKALPDGAQIALKQEGERVTLKSGRSRFTLSTLSAGEFPTVETINAEHQLTLSMADLSHLLDKTHFAMAHQDVRYYLNGLLLEVKEGFLRAVATDGHRLALAETQLSGVEDSTQQVIIPRKGVLELQRLLGADDDVTLALGSNHVQVDLGTIRFTSKLIDGRFPDYGRVIPQGADNAMVADRETLKQALGRAAILSNEKYRGIRLELAEGKVVIQAHNPEQEEAEEEVEVSYTGDELEIGFNVSYLMDALSAIDGDKVEIGLKDAASSCIIKHPTKDTCRYVVMPMRL